MERNTLTTLAVKFWGTIETPPVNSREEFRQGVIDTVLSVLKSNNITVDYIGYKPDSIGIHHLNSVRTIYEDCVFVSLNMQPRSSQIPDEYLPESIINDLIKVFEHKTHKHLEVDAAVVDDLHSKRTIEMTSDWNFYLKQG